MFDNPGKECIAGQMIAIGSKTKIIPGIRARHCPSAHLSKDPGPDELSGWTKIGLILIWTGSVKTT